MTITSIQYGIIVRHRHTADNAKHISAAFFYETTTLHHIKINKISRYPSPKIHLRFVEYSDKTTPR